MEFNQDNKVVQLCAKGMELEGQGRFTDAASFFYQAWNEANSDFEKFTAAHYVARHQESVSDKLQWDKTALQHALNINDATVKAGLPSLYLNIAKCYEDLKHLDHARDNYKTAFSFIDFLPNNEYGNMIKKGIANGLERTRQEHKPCSTLPDNLLIRLAATDDINKIIGLNSKYMLDGLSLEERKEGFLGKLYSKEELTEIIQSRQMVVAVDKEHIIGYYMIGSKIDPDAAGYRRNETLWQVIGQEAPLDQIAYPVQICIDKYYRGKGLFGEMLRLLSIAAASKFSLLLCSISEENDSSFRAHVRNGWSLINCFEGRYFLRYRIAK